VRWFETLTIRDVSLVGGKNASLGEMIRTLKKQKIAVPEGFALTAQAYRDLLLDNQLYEVIEERLEKRKKGKLSLEKAGAGIRTSILQARLSEEWMSAVRQAYALLSRRCRQKNVDVAVRSSATAEDLPKASFAGQQETYLHVRGEKELFKAALHCYASLFTDRAITYREANGFDHLKVALSIGIQRMVRSDLGGAGVLFTLDPETGFRSIVLINASWGLGENVVQGTVTPDEYIVFKPFLKKKGCNPILSRTCGDKSRTMVYAKKGTKNTSTPLRKRKVCVLKDKEILTLAAWGKAIEKHYGKPMDVEWAKDGRSQQLFVVQARPETVQSQRKANTFTTYALKQKAKPLCQGLAIGDPIVHGTVQVIKKVADIHRFVPGHILVTEMTTPDWVPIMQKASGIITDHGGRTSHAAIVSRELGIPAIVGTNDGTRILKDQMQVTLSCAEGSRGYIYKGELPFATKEVSLDHLPKPSVRLMMNIASPDAAFRYWRLPCRGIGLARMEFIVNDIIKIHPMALLHPERVKEVSVRKQIRQLTQGYAHPADYFVHHLAEGVAKIAASRYPDPVIVRMSDFKTNEYANLIGGAAFEPKEENPMLGFRGASRYYNPRYEEGFALECQAIRKVRDQMGFSNVIVMIPFCRTLQEADAVLRVLARNGLKRKVKGLQIYVMAEIPSNIILAKEFCKRFDGFSIGSNDLTQLLLGIDRDCAELAPLFDERNPAVKEMILQLIRVAHRYKKKVGICGQAPSDYSEFASFLIQAGIDSISLNPDSVVPTLLRLRDRG
jgi:pyruvate,water dikinase